MIPNSLAIDSSLSNFIPVTSSYQVADHFVYDGKDIFRGVLCTKCNTGIGKLELNRNGSVFFLLRAAIFVANNSLKAGKKQSDRAKALLPELTKILLELNDDD